jgi:hypothetical protein
MERTENHHLRLVSFTGRVRRCGSAFAVKRIDLKACQLEFGHISLQNAVAPTTQPLFSTRMDGPLDYHGM